MKLKLRDEQKGLIFIAIIVVIMVAVGVFFAFSLKTDFIQDTIDNEDGLIRMLFVVEKDTADETHEELFSTVLIYDPKSHKAASFNLPGYTGSIFASLERSDSFETVYKECGVDTYKTEVEKMLGIKIPFISVISEKNFIKITDMLGGLRVFIPSPVDITSQDGVRWLLPSGAVNLDGDKIAVYLQYVDPDETEDDVQDRYQNVMVAFLSGLSEKKFIIFNKNNFKKISSCIDSNVSESDEANLFELLADVDADSTIRQTITGSVRTVDDKQLMFPLDNGNFIKTAVKQTTSMLDSAEGTYSGHVYTIEIQNGTNQNGLAKRTADLYNRSSYKVMAPADADRHDYEQTVIIDHLGNDAAAKMVGDLIKCTNIITEDSEEDGSDSSAKSMADFTIILGSDFNGQYVVAK